MNLGQLTNRVMDATLRGGALQGGNRDQVKEDINEAIKEVDALLRPVVNVALLPLVAGQGDYSIITDFGITTLTSIRSISYSGIAAGRTYELQPTTPFAIRERRQIPAYATYVWSWALEGRDTLLLYPISQSVGDTISLFWVPRPADLVLETDEPVGLPPEFHDLYEVAAIKRSMRQTSPEYSQMYYQLFQQRLNDYRKYKNHREGPRRVVAGALGRRMLPSDPSTDLGY